jgi:hypothetical protein
MKNCSYLLVSLLLMSCSTGKEIIPNVEEKSNVIVAELGDLNTKSAPFKISSVQIVGNIMTLEVNYSGGCKEHDFKMIGSNMIAKSMPPIRSIKLIDSVMDDSCKKLEIKNITVDISALAYKKESGSEIYITLDGWDQKIKYVFQ